MQRGNNVDTGINLNALHLVLKKSSVGEVIK